MNIAKVIVDVPASVVNQTFDYKIPTSLIETVQPGMRVTIPFGNRKITGFVLELTDHSPFENLKEIINILDVTPVLTKELLNLGMWLANEILSLYIITFQAMLPQVLKSKYDKEIVRVEGKSLQGQLATIFKDQQAVNYDELVKQLKNVSELKHELEAGNLQLKYIVKSQITKKYENWIIPAGKESFIKLNSTLPSHAHQQRKIVEFFIANPKKINENKLCDMIQINKGNLKSLIEKGLLKIEKVEVYREPYEQSFSKTENFRLTEEQANALQPINEALNRQEHKTFLLYGVTGSGKTEIYLQAIEKVIEKGKEAIVLVPEISLTPQMVRRFKGRFGSHVAVMHSALSVGERYDEWLKVQRKEVKVVVGARSAVFAPFENIGIIIIDEEHEATYKQEETPRYHARNVAIKRGEWHQCPVILGSATPTLESFARGKKGVYHLLTLTERTNKKPMPFVKIIDMREELHSGNRTMFSKSLMEGIRSRIQKKEQIVLLLNRRGYSNFALCRDCGHVEECPHCDISLTYHKRNYQLKCHYCSHEQPMPSICSNCQSSHIRFFGTGTEKVEESLTKIIPEARVIRMDVDTTRRKGSHERLLQKFSNFEADILLGTQMIAKGLDFENVTLVGVLAADSMLHLPDFRSSEKTFQLLTQVSGRAGRHELEGEVIVQTYTPEHYSIELASQYNYDQFYLHEMQLRKRFMYSPYVFMLLITVTDENEGKVNEVIFKISHMLQQKLNEKSFILGPTPSPITRIKNRYRYQLIVKYKYEPNLSQYMQQILKYFTDEIRKNTQILIDFNPNHFM